MLMQSFVLGSSVVVGELALRAFAPPFGNLNFPGLFAPTLSQTIALVLLSEVATPLFAARPQVRVPVSIVLVTLTPVGFALAGGSVAVQSTTMLYLAFLLVLGVAYSAFDGLTRMEILQWWDVDARKRIGMALMGASAGIGAIFFTLFTGWVVNYASLQVGLYTLSGWMAIGAVWISYAMLTGGLDPAPTPEEYDQWVKAAKNSARSDEMSTAETGKDVEQQTDYDSAERTLPSSSSSDATAVLEDELDRDAATKNAASSSAQVDIETGTDDEDKDDRARRRPIGTSPSVPVLLKSRFEGLRYPMHVCVALVAGMQAFYGYSTKVLLSSMFQLIFGLPLMTSAYLSALTLLGFLISRVLAPLLLMGRGLSATFISAIGAALACIGYAVLPSIIGSEEYASEAFSWRLFGFICAKLLISLCFGVAQGFIGAVAIDAVGLANAVTAFRNGWFLGALGISGGPISAWLITFNNYYDGEPFAKAFHTFFYIAAGVAAIDLIVLLFMLHTTQRAAAGEARDEDLANNRSL